MKIIKTNHNRFKINKNAGRTTYTIKAHDYVFIGVAQCSDKDDFDEGKGMRIAHLRAEIAYRRYEAQLTKDFIDTLKTGMEQSLYREGAASKMYMTTIQNASANLDTQYKRIRKREEQLKRELL